MNKQIMKEFVESYFKNNGVELHIDKNKVYTVELKDVLANRLGKVLKFSFNKEIAEDYGVDYIYPNSRIFRFIVRDSINKGLVSKGELTSEKIFDVK